MRRWLPAAAGPDGNPQPLAFEARDHVAVGEPLGLDFDMAAKLSARASLSRGPIARLHRALAQFMLDLQTGTHGYTECYTPYIVNASTLYGTGQCPSSGRHVRRVQGGGDDDPKVDDQGKPYVREDQYLISTSEITLTSVARDAILAAAGCRSPPIRRASVPRPAAAARDARHDPPAPVRQGRDGAITAPDQSYEALEEMVGHAERVLQLLELPYRVVLLCTGDMGFGAAKTYDLEVWLPAQNTWREISSVSNCETFQARRMQARFPQCPGQARVRAYVERFRPGRGPRAGGRAGKPPAAGWRCGRAQGAAALHGRPDGAQALSAGG